MVFKHKNGRITVIDSIASVDIVYPTSAETEMRYIMAANERYADIQRRGTSGTTSPIPPQTRYPMPEPQEFQDGELYRPTTIEDVSPISDNSTWQGIFNELANKKDLYCQYRLTSKANYSYIMDIMNGAANLQDIKDLEEERERLVKMIIECYG